MMTLFRKYIIGGATGSREGAWLLVLLLVIAPVTAVVVGDLMGKDMSVTSGLLMVLCPAVLTLWATAHGLQKLIDSKLFKNQRQLEEALVE